MATRSGPCDSAGKETDGAATIRVIATDDGSAQWEWRDGRFANVEALAWDPAGGRVAAEVCESTCRVAIVDETGALTGLFTPLEPADQTVSLAWGAAGLRTLEVCCRDPFDEGDTALRLRSIDPATGTGTELYVFEGEAEPTESELVAAGDDWFLLRRSASFDGVDAELSRIDLAADPAVERLAEGPTAIAEP